ncbi:MAG TPA: protease pro-enzyme activation domain-containing protein [Solirubrobacteraceae bacterium]|nr:protease pro-enzyme activation domain-containing protein [Solirubrobacteraceae bacterium]
MALCAAGLLAWPGAARAAMHAVGTAPQLVAGSQYQGALPASAALQVSVVLAPRDPAALASFLHAVSTPGSPQYGHYLAPGQFGPRFGASAHTIASVSAALHGAGLSPGTPTANDLSIPVRGDAAQVSSALHVQFARYRLPGGRIGFANTAAPTLPASATAGVRDVVGLQSLYEPSAVGLQAGPARASPLVSGGPVACAQAGALPADGFGYTIDQLAEGYDLDPLYSSGDLGAGTTVGIYELETNLTSDITTFDACFRIDPSIGYIPVDGGASASASGDGEAALDIEEVAGLAPAANIQVFQGPNGGVGPFDLLQAMADQDTSQINTTSWGECEQDMLLGDPNEITAEEIVFDEMAIQGQTMYAASGDGGSEDCQDVQINPNPNQNAIAVEDPASQQLVTGVGGTSLASAFNAGRPTGQDAAPLTIPPFQSAWNNAAANDGASGGASGGGISVAQQMPGYQAAAPASLDVINSSSSGQPCGAPAGGYCREVPDVSADADPRTGYSLYWTSTGPNGSEWGLYGGTSGAAPFWAGMTALIDADNAGGCTVPGTFGEINVLLYDIAAGPSAADALTDIGSAPAGFPSNNDYPLGASGGYPVGPEYDMVTGLGTPLAGGARGLAAQLCTLRGPVTSLPVLTTVSPTTGPPGTAVTIDGIGLIPGATVSVGGIPAVDVHVISFNQLSATIPAGSGVQPISVTTANGTGNAINYHYQPTTATVTVTDPGAQTGMVTSAEILQIAAQDTDGGALSYAASGLPAGMAISAASGLISGTPTAPGTTSVTITATDAFGPTGQATFTWTIAGAPVPETVSHAAVTTATGNTPAPAPQGEPSPAPTGVSISALRISPARFAVAKGKHARRGGTEISYTLSAPSTVTITFVRRLAHHRTRTVGRLVRTSGAGPHTVRFTGRLGRRALPVGSYVAHVSVTPAAGASSRASAALKVIRARQARAADALTGLL